MDASTITTRLLVLSDTHGQGLHHLPEASVDVAIHCGDLTDGSKLDEFRTTIKLLESLPAPLKLVIAGNHDFTLDTPNFKSKLDAITPPPSDEVVKREYGEFGEARSLFESESAKSAGIVFLEEGPHQFQLLNGAILTVYASPYTPSLSEWSSDSSSDWAFQYSRRLGHDWKMDEPVDIAITHGPPEGILDRTGSRTRAGCPSLFAAVARVRPRLHCFGHIHVGWGAKQVTWRDEVSETPSHFTDIDNSESRLIVDLPRIKPNKYDAPEVVTRKEEEQSERNKKGYCTATAPPQRGTQTLFVNASIEGQEDDQQQLPWIVDIDLPRTGQSRKA